MNESKEEYLFEMKKMIIYAAFVYGTNLR